MKISFGLGFLLLFGTSGSNPSEPAPPATTEVAEKGTKEPPVKESDICLTPGCVLAAADVLKKVNIKADPCDNFYEFACGKFLKETIIPDDKTSVDQFVAVRDKVTERLKLVLEEPSKDNEARPFKLAKELYKMCRDKNMIEDKGLKYIRNIVDEMGGWPVLIDEKNWDESKFSWIDTVYKFKEKGLSIDYLIDFAVRPNAKDSTKRVIELDQPSLSLGKKYLDIGMDDERVDALYKYRVDFAVLFGADPARAKKELKESLEFEIALAKISKLPEERRDSNRLYNKMSISKLKTDYPSIPWDKYFSNILPKGTDLQPDEDIIVNELDYIKQLENLLTKFSSRAVANYMFSRAVGSTVFYLTENLRARHLKLQTVMTGQSQQPPRWKECVGVTSERLPLAVGSLYVKNFFKLEAKTNLLEMVDNIREEMSKILENVKWMNDKTRENGKAKATKMINHIAYPEEILDENELTNFYKELKIKQDSYLETVLNIDKFDLERALGRLRKPVDKNDWTTRTSPAIVNAFYTPSYNSIQFPAAIMQGAFYSNDRPNYMNYGGIGYVIGHEITHGFDDEGRQFDKDGNLVDWWSPEIKENYDKKAQCIIDQYGNYYSEQAEKKLNGVNTQGENIADNGGIKLAYRAYNRWVEKTKTTEKRLPGLQNFTPQQMFWISGASVWCTKYRPAALKLMIDTGVHSPGEFRVRGPFSNRPEFAKDFGCPSGSKMNPTNQCEVW